MNEEKTLTEESNRKMKDYLPEMRHKKVSYAVLKTNMCTTIRQKIKIWHGLSEKQTELSFLGRDEKSLSLYHSEKSPKNLIFFKILIGQYTQYSIYLIFNRQQCRETKLWKISYYLINSLQDTSWFVVKRNWQIDRKSVV